MTLHTVTRRSQTIFRAVVNIRARLARRQSVSCLTPPFRPLGWTTFSILPRRTTFKILVRLSSCSTPCRTVKTRGAPDGATATEWRGRDNPEHAASANQCSHTTDAGIEYALHEKTRPATAIHPYAFSSTFVATNGRRSGHCARVHQCGRGQVTGRKPWTTSGLSSDR